MDNELISAKVIAYTESPLGDKLITIETTSPKFLDAECVTKDTVLHFETYTDRSKGTKCLRKMTVEDFFEKWDKGIAIPHAGKTLKLNFANVILDKVYTFPELSRALDKYDDYVGYLNRRYSIPHTNRQITGSKFISWYNIPYETVSYRDYKDTLKKMSLRCMNLDNETKDITNIKDIWKAGEKEILKIVSGSESIRVSKNQLIYTQRGWVKAIDLDIEEDSIFRISHLDRKIIPKNYLSFNRKIKPTLLKEQNNKCKSCKKEIDFSCDVHHILPVSKFPEYAKDLNNVVALCEECHIIEHTGNKSSSTYPGLYKIDSITNDGIEMTYDIEVAHPDKNYIANSFIIHNCEKHRTLSTNSSSSRAIPFKRTLDADTFLPYDIRKDEKGMQGYEILDEFDSITFQALALEMYDFTVGRVKDMKDLLNVHKQHLNRYIEPWTVQRKVMTGNIEWFDYFISLRSAKDADPNIQDLSRKIDTAITSAKPTFSTWHMPYVRNYENELDINDQLVHSVARCARVSYNNFDGKKSILEQDKKLFKFLSESMHLTPFEHQAQIMTEVQINPVEDFYTAISNIPKGITHVDLEGCYHSGNFHGFIQHRQMF